MPVSTRRTPVSRLRVGELWQKLMVDGGLFKPWASDGDTVTDATLSEYRIQITRFDLQMFLELGSDYESPTGPILFKPLALEQFRQHPIDWKDEDDMLREVVMTYQDYPSDHSMSTTNRFLMGLDSISAETQIAHWYLHNYALGGMRRKGDLESLHNLQPIHLPHPFLLPQGPTCPFDYNWDTEPCLEYKEVERDHNYPHLILMSQQFAIGKDDSILVGEVAAIVEALNARVTQPVVVQQEDVMEGEESDLFDEGPASRKNMPLAFPKEQNFPILMISFVGPRHARVLYASMNYETLVIQQSPLYSFEKGATAPWDLFSCILLSRPLRSHSEIPL